MSNGARHGLGVLFGLIVTPVIAACMMYGTEKIGRSVRTLAFDGGDRWVGAAALLFAAVLLGLAAGSRRSEERRVGKEWSSRSRGYDEQKRACKHAIVSD